MITINVDTVPPAVATGDRKLGALLTETARLSELHAEAFREREAASRAGDTASTADAQALAAALRAGEPDPGPVAQREAEDRQAAAQRQLDGVALALALVAEEVVDHVTEQRSRLTARCDDADGKARALLADVGDRLTAALTAHAAALTARRWLDSVAANTTPSASAFEPVLRLRDRMGARCVVDAAAIVDALHDLADPSRVEAREQEDARSLRPGVPQMISPQELVTGRGPLAA